MKSFDVLVKEVPLARDRHRPRALLMTMPKWEYRWYRRTGIDADDPEYA